AQQYQAQKASGQVGLFGGMAKAPSFKLPNTPEWAVGERMKYEKETLGLFLTGHPIEAFAEEVQRFASAPIDGLRRLHDKDKVAVAGIVAAFRVIKTGKGDKMAFVTLEDVGGTVECVFFPKALPRAQAVLEGGRPVLIRGVVEHKGEEVKILADTAEWLEDIRERSTALVELSLRTHELGDDAITALLGLLEGNRGPAAVKVWLEEPGLFRTRIGGGENVRVAATPKLVEGLRALFGRTDAVRLS
ncbi:MAG: OB-fold nucleic acid binding domain-containing protein, partial [Myxococcota bacterium]